MATLVSLVALYICWSCSKLVRINDQHPCKLHWCAAGLPSVFRGQADLELKRTCSTGQREPRQHLDLRPTADLEMRRFHG